MRYGLAERLQVGIDLPWVSQSKGSLDGFIEDLHDFFGFPMATAIICQIMKSTMPMQTTMAMIFWSITQNSGIGDIRLLAAWQWLATTKTGSSLQASDQGADRRCRQIYRQWRLGCLSGVCGAQRNFPLEKGSASLWGGLGGSWLGDGEVLEDQAEDWAASGWLGAGWSPLDWLGLKLQLDGNTALYDSDLDEIGDPALILTMGGTLGLGEKTSLDIGVGEDLSVNASLGCYLSYESCTQILIRHKICSSLVLPCS